MQVITINKEKVLSNPKIMKTPHHNQVANPIAA